eukprot:CAMPEP_0185278332 /NCGR_PEP_ID=MMETSP1359-20130426/60779_1 /TAXON_ID=552665 /ORGANISM="Bigelowiella longifila, Strain CCMP242" /LENGTH=160 /DNA_ID=CAMNT_0027872789 /DNA_START=174 /DNA_END=656 /DNA_ORIENTATION=+
MIHKIGGIPATWVRDHCESGEGMFIECVLNWWLESNNVHQLSFQELDIQIVRSCRREQICNLQMCDKPWSICGQKLPRTALLPIRECKEHQTCAAPEPVRFIQPKERYICSNAKGHLGICKDDDEKNARNLKYSNGTNGYEEQEQDFTHPLTRSLPGGAN